MLHPFGFATFTSYTITLISTLSHAQNLTYCLPPLLHWSSLHKRMVSWRVSRIGMDWSPIFFPVLAMIRQVCHLQLHNAHPTTPIYTYYSLYSPQQITTMLLTAKLRFTTYIIGQAMGIHPTDISIRSLRSSGAKALLCADVNPDKIRLLG